MNYTLVFEQAEQIGVHHITTKADVDSAGGSVGVETDFQVSMRYVSSAVKMLQERFSAISRYNNAVADGQLPADDEIMSKEKRIVVLLGSLDNEEQKERGRMVSSFQCVLLQLVNCFCLDKT